ncbi:TPA: molecular chaperone [Escherichia coli]|nr:molecular chaperone [Escherichia coli]
MFNKLILPLLIVFPYITNAADLRSETKSYSVTLGASRIIFDDKKNASSLLVENKQEYPVLIESRIMDESSEKKSSEYFVTPPLFRLDPGQKNSISVIKTSNEFPLDTESLNWICVKSVPPTKGSAWADSNTKNESTLNIDILVNNCIKIITRPSALDNIKDGSYGSKLRWSVSNSTLSVENPTPYYINFSSINLDKRNITPPVFLKPKSSYAFNKKIDIKGGDKIRWKLIDDYGAPTSDFESIVHTAIREN